MASKLDGPRKQNVRPDHECAQGVGWGARRVDGGTANLSCQKQYSQVKDMILSSFCPWISHKQLRKKTDWLSNPVQILNCYTRRHHSVLILLFN